jgi:hypothetical protein
VHPAASLQALTIAGYCDFLEAEVNTHRFPRRDSRLGGKRSKNSVAPAHK